MLHGTNMALRTEQVSAQAGRLLYSGLALPSFFP
jgi:hypothetical protein